MLWGFNNLRVRGELDMFPRKRLEYVQRFTMPHSQPVFAFSEVICLDRGPVSCHQTPHTAPRIQRSICLQTVALSMVGIDMESR